MSDSIAPHDSLFHVTHHIERRLHIDGVLIIRCALRAPRGGEALGQQLCGHKSGRDTVLRESLVVDIYRYLLLLQPIDIEPSDTLNRP